MVTALIYEPARNKSLIDLAAENIYRLSTNTRYGKMERTDGSFEMALLL